jgi:GAF domain-containing protein/anti-sigma regulatory factor (Ser/Thr protein kinase)
MPNSPEPIHVARSAASLRRNTDEQKIASIRLVLSMATDVLWQADAGGRVTSVTPCRPAKNESGAWLDEVELQNIEQRWMESVRTGVPLEETYHVRNGREPARVFRVQAAAVRNDDDDVISWSGMAIAVASRPDEDVRFLSQAAAALSSSMNRSAVAARLAQVAVEHFSEACAVHVLDDDGAVAIAGSAARFTDDPGGREKAFARLLASKQGPLADVMRSGCAFHAVDGAADAASNEDAMRFLRTTGSRSLIAVPLSIGASCIGAISFLESRRTRSFEARDVELGIVVGRQLATTLENIRSFEREQKTTERFRFLARATAGLFVTLDRTAMVERLLQGLVEDFADWAVAATLTDDGLRALASAHAGDVDLPKVDRFGVPRDLTAEGELIAAARAGRPYVLSGLSRSGEGGGPRAWMLVPLSIGEARYGAIICYSSRHTYDESDLELLEEIGRRTSLALEHAESFERERRLTRILQQATLPSDLADVPNASVSAIYSAAAREERVGGDWYDAFDLGEDRVLLTIGDVTGHGLAASIVMAKVRHALNVVAMYERDLSRVVDVVEQIVLRRFPNAIATAFIAVLDTRKKTITYANAGHPYPLLRLRDGTQKELVAGGLPIGLRHMGKSDPAKSADVADAALLVFYTDGLTETTRDAIAGQRLISETLDTDAILRVRSPADFIKIACKANEGSDDVAILALNFVDNYSWTFESADEKAAQRARREFVERLRTGVGRDVDLEAAELIFGELIANVARHAPGQVDVALEPRGPEAVLHVIDRGKGYASTDGARADLLAESGRGLWLIRRLAGNCGIEIIPSFGTHVSVRLPARQLAQ